MQRELQEAWAAYRVLDDAQATLRGNLWRTHVIGKERHVVVRSVEIGMVEKIERIGFKPQLVALFKQELLGQAGVEAHLERTSKSIAARSSIQGFIVIAPGRIASRNPIGPRSHELGSKISRVELAELRRDSGGAISAPCCLLGSYAG